jgi:hypothetical protein
MEEEYPDLLLMGDQPVLVCPARSVERMCLPGTHKNGVEAGRLALMLPLGTSQRRAKADLAEERNRFVAALATEVFVAYATPEGKTERLCRLLMEGGTSVLTQDLPENARLLELGAKPVVAEDLARRWTV